MIILLAFGISPMLNAQDVSYKLGDVVEEFSLKNIDEQYVSLNQYRDRKGVIVIFTCNHCPYSQAYEQRIMELDNKFSSASYPVLALNPNDPAVEPDDSYEKMQQRATDKGYLFPYLVDYRGTVAKKFGATKTPHVFILKNTADGFKLVYKGAIDDNTESAEKATQRYVEMAIADLELEKLPSVSETKAIGCTIKWGGPASDSKGSATKGKK